jgi:hypothetical protein
VNFATNFNCNIGKFLYLAQTHHFFVTPMAENTKIPDVHTLVNAFEGSMFPISEALFLLTFLLLVMRIANGRSLPATFVLTVVVGVIPTTLVAAMGLITYKAPICAGFLALVLLAADELLEALSPFVIAIHSLVRKGLARTSSASFKTKDA